MFASRPSTLEGTIHRSPAADSDDNRGLCRRHVASAGGTGPGAEERRSIAVLAVGGQTLSLVPTLLAVPVIYTFLDDVGALLSRRRRRPLESSSEETTEMKEKTDDLAAAAMDSLTTLSGAPRP